MKKVKAPRPTPKVVSTRPMPSTRNTAPPPMSRGPASFFGPGVGESLAPTKNYKKGR